MARDILEQVTPRPRAQALKDVLVVVKGRQDDDAGLGPALPQPPGSLHAIHARHTHIHEYDVGPKVSIGLQGCLPLHRLTHDHQVGLQFQQDAQALAHKLLVIHQQDTDLLRHHSPPPVSRSPAVSDPSPDRGSGLP